MSYYLHRNNYVHDFMANYEILCNYNTKEKRESAIDCLVLRANRNRVEL